MDSASGSSSGNPLDNLPPALAQIIQLALDEFIKESLPAIYIMIIASLWLGISLCLLMALLWSARPEKRKTPLFVSCVVAVGFGTVPAILFLNLLVKSFTGAVDDNDKLLEEMKPYIFALTFFSFFSSICVDCILLIRLLPLLRVPGAPPMTMVLGPLFVIKLGRIAAVVVLVVNFIKKSRTLPPSEPFQLYTVVTVMPEPRAAWSLQLIDNALCSFLFIYLLKRAISMTLKQSTGFGRRLRALFLIAASSFVFPVIFVIVELIFMTRKLGYFALASINISGTNVEIIGVLFATIWASRGKDEKEVYYNHKTSSSSTSSGRYPDSGKIRRSMSRVLDISVTRETATPIQTFRQTGSSTSDADAVANTMEMSSLNERDDSMAPSVKKPVTSLAIAAV